jgi:hypothetical protein
MCSISLAGTGDKKRLLVLTDIGGDPDDQQSMVRLLLYANEFDLEGLISRMRVYDIAGQDDCGGWICHNFPDIFWLRSVDMFQAISVRKARPFPPHVTGPNLETFTTEWVADNVRNHGPLGALYPERIWKYEGDTPAFLHLLPTGLNDPEKITHGGWGGRFNLARTVNPPTFAKRYTEAEKKFRDFEMHTGAKDSWRYEGKTYNSHYAGLFRWREPFQNDFAARLDWSLADSYEKANHNPIAAFDYDRSRKYVCLNAKPGENVKLSAAGSSDPDGDRISYRWFHYPEAGDDPYEGSIEIRNANTISAGFVMPDIQSNQEIHVILEVKDSGEPALYGYRRIIVK